MTIINFVSETYIRENTPINQNVDAKDIATNVGIAQEMNLEPILGSTFYDYLQVAYSAETLTPDETVLMGHIKPFVAYSAIEMALPFLHYQVKNKGISTQFGDNSQAAENSVMIYLKKEIGNRKEWMAARLERYLMLNQSLFPLYVTQGNVDIQPDRDSGYDSGFSTYDNYPNSNRCNGFNGFFNSNGY